MNTCRSASTWGSCNRPPAPARSTVTSEGWWQLGHLSSKFLSSLFVLSHQCFIYFIHNSSDRSPISFYQPCVPHSTKRLLETVTNEDGCPPLVIADLTDLPPDMAPVGHASIETAPAPLEIPNLGNSAKHSVDTLLSPTSSQSPVTILSPSDTTSLASSLQEDTAPASSKSKRKKTKKNKFLSFLSLKEPSQSAFEQLAKQQSAQTQKGLTSPTSFYGVNHQKLPPTVPKVNSKWDGLPENLNSKDSSRRNSETSSKSRIASPFSRSKWSLPTGTRQGADSQAVSLNSRASTGKRPSQQSDMPFDGTHPWQKASGSLRPGGDPKYESVDDLPTMTYFFSEPLESTTQPGPCATGR